MSTRKRLGLALGLIALGIGHFVSAGRMPAEAGEPKAKADEPKNAEKTELGKGQRAKEFIAAFNRGDAKSVAGFWVADGNYVDQVGRQTKGREALEKLYQKVFAGAKGAKLAIFVTSAKLVTPEVALEEGISEVTPADGGPPTAARFSAVLVKKEGEWYFESVHESVASPPSNAEHFDEIEWLIGEWASDAEKGESMKASYEWAENKNFMVSSFATTLKDIPVIHGTQWIAWDAIDKQIRSWSFYSGGGFGEAVWINNLDHWLLKTTARTSAGKKISATNVIRKVDNDTCTWQLTKLMVDGEPQPDAKPIKMKRVKAPQP
jgi:uncharacterized protein (TIGR02246 family)